MLAPGTTSYVMVISTNAAFFDSGNVRLLDGGSFTGAAFQPAGAPVPEGGTSAGLLALGLIVLAGGGRLLLARV
jgi:hypothetical protein